jgi:hypothetical protein
MTPVISPPRRPYLYSDESNNNYTTYPPFYANPGARTAHPRRHIGTQDKAWPPHVAPADGEAKKSMHISSLCYKGSCSRRIRRKTAAPEDTFFVFLFRLFSILPFYHKRNLSPTLGNYKRRGRGHIYGRRTHLAKTTHTYPSKRPGIRSLSRKLVTPTTSTPMQGNISSSRIHWTQGHSCPNQYTPLCPLCTPSGPRRADTNSLVALPRPRF